MFRDGAARVLVFRLGDEYFAVALDAVDEVIDAPAMRPLPDAAGAVRGVAAVRGELITIYDPRAVLGVAGRVGGAALLFHHDARRGSQRLGVLVDDVHDAITVDAQDVQSAPGAGASDGLLAGLVRRGGDLIALLDVHALIDALLDALPDVLSDALPDRAAAAADGEGG
jgi:purine-binding chemotaxis protein CheW